MDRDESQQLATLLYERLRAMAHSRMNGQPDAHTLDPTGLANEAMMRLLKCDPAQIQDEKHFLALAAEAMRQILVDHARTKRAKKRGGGTTPESLHDDMHPTMQLRAEPEEVLALSEALTALESEDPEAATIVKMRAFAGMSPEEISALLGVSKRTIERRWRFAMADLRVRIDGTSHDASGGAGDDQPR